MRRRRSRKQAVNVSLFPFLAVLVCTMGSLVVLLVLVVQQARVYANEVADRTQKEPPADQQREDLQLAEDDFRWRREVLEEERIEMTAGQANQRLELGHLEEHILQLHQRWKQLQTQAVELEKLGRSSQQEGESNAEQLRRLQQAVQQARQELERARQAAQNRTPSFAIIPYEGPHGTRRRPVYVECRQDGVILQPEGIVLNAEDFEGPNDPGNPLNSALRAIREHLARVGSIEQGGEPYPLLIVRPGGTVAYLAAREAMQSWDDEFGYELIDADMQLKYPPADPDLKEHIARAVQDARQRQAILIAAMPSQYRGRGTAGFVATPHRGGFVPIGPGSTPGDAPDHGSGSGAGRGETGDEAEQASRWPDENSGPAGGTGGPNRSPSSAAGGASFALADSRGANWALPDASAQATGITRPIRLAVLPDRLVILPQRGEHPQPRVVPAPGAIQDSIDQLVSEIWKHIEQWGIAVMGGYWQPVLQVEVAPGAQARFAELESLLQGSGLEVQRTSP